MLKSVKVIIKKMLCLLKGVKTGSNTYIAFNSKIKNANKISLGKDVYVDSHARIDASRENSSISIGDNTLVHEYSLIKANGGKISIGRDCTVNDYSILYGHGGLVIGNDVHIAAHVVIVPANHIYENPDIFISKQGETKKGIIIEDDVWLGANAVILDGVTIGRGSIVGAGAVVTRSVPPCVVVAGSPAKVIKKREFK